MPTDARFSKPHYFYWTNRGYVGETLQYTSPTNHAGRGPKGYKRSDERIKEDICEHLALDPYIDASEIEVDVEDGVVRLLGRIENRQMKKLTEDVIESLPGVKDIFNELTCIH